MLWSLRDYSNLLDYKHFRRKMGFRRDAYILHKPFHATPDPLSHYKLLSS